MADPGGPSLRSLIPVCVHRRLIAAEPAAGPALRCVNDLRASNLCRVGEPGAGREAGLATALTESPRTLFYYYPASGPPCGLSPQHAVVTDEENQ